MTNTNCAESEGDLSSRRGSRQSHGGSPRDLSSAPRGRTGMFRTAAHELTFISKRNRYAVNLAGKEAGKRKGDGKHGGRGTGRSTGGGSSLLPRRSNRIVTRVAVRPGTRTRADNTAQSFRVCTLLTKKPHGMGPEQWLDYLAACDGKIRWSDYRRKWGPAL
jgi:hypothetical protein